MFVVAINAKLANFSENGDIFGRKTDGKNYTSGKLLAWCRVLAVLIPIFVAAFKAVEGVGAAEGVAVGDVLLPLAGVPLAVLLGVVLAVELPEGYGVGVVFVPPFELTYALFVFPLGVRGRI